MKQAALFVAGLFFALTVTAQEQKETLRGNGNIVKENREITTYNKISVNGFFEVELVPAENNTVLIEGDENIINILTTEVKDGTLFISTVNEQPVIASRKHKIKFKVPYSTLQEISLIGCGTITSNKIIKSDNFKVTVDGPGSIALSIKAVHIDSWVLGSGTINIKGTAQKFMCKVVGSGNIKGYGLNAENVVAFISGSGNAQVNSTTAISGKIIGTGNITFSGEPKEKALKLLGSGSGSFNRFE